jgi:hypothetical protein
VKSCYLDGTGDYLTTPDHADFDFSAGVWTQDFWIYPTNVSSGNQVLWSQATDGSNYIAAYVLSGGNVYIEMLAGGSTVIAKNSVAGLVANNGWYHIEFSENGNDWYMFVNGVQALHFTDAHRPDNYTGTFQVGDKLGAQFLAGYIDEFRVSNGVCRHTAAFTPMSSAYNPIPIWTTPTYGEMWYHADTGSYTQGLTTGTQAIIACFDTATNGQLNTGFTYSTSALTCTVAGTYKVNYHVSVASSSSNHKYHFWIGLNESGGSATGEQLQTENHCKPVNSTDVIACSGGGLITLKVGDVITLFGNDETAGNSTLTVFAANVTLNKL